MKPYHIFKRITDIVGSSVGIIILSPLFILAAIWIKSTSDGPIVFKQTRLGKNKRPFEIYKFRTMIVSAEEMQKKGIPTKELITPAGRFLRRTFLDETLQLFNILKGDMSLVGPRPRSKDFFEECTKVCKECGSILKIKPGLTSLDSVADYLPDEERIKFEEHFKSLLKKDIQGEIYCQNFREHERILESYYANNESFKYDLMIIFYTILLWGKKIFSRQSQK